MTTITILAEDIYATDYEDIRDCAMTRALKRAGLEGYRDWGIGIVDKAGRVVVPCTLPTYREMSDKVVSMYGHAGTLKDPENFTFSPTPLTPPKDFSITLPI